MIAIRDRLVAIGGYVVEPIRSFVTYVLRPLPPVQRGIALARRGVALAVADLDLEDLQAITAVLIYLVLGTVITVWAASLFILVRWMVGY